VRDKNVKIPPTGFTMTNIDVKAYIVKAAMSAKDPGIYLMRPYLKINGVVSVIPAGQKQVSRKL
jgi:hypothetical protein